MRFEEALGELRNGKAVQRSIESWTELNFTIRLDGNRLVDTSGCETDLDGIDLIADDWEVVMQKRKGKWVVQSWKYEGWDGEYGREYCMVPDKCMSFLEAREAMEWMEHISASSTATSGLMFQVRFQEGDYEEDER